jgi:hypothetical protein
MNLLANCDRHSGSKKLINDLGLKRGIEVGVRECYFADHLLGTKLEVLYGVDIAPIWENVRQMQARYPADRWIFSEGKSPDFASQFADGFFDFIYIDAGHSYKEVMADLHGWWPKLRVGGAIMLDDWMFGSNYKCGENFYGVPQATCQFVEDMGQDLYVTGMDGPPNDFDKFFGWALYNSYQAWRGNNGHYAEFKQNVQGYIIKK